MAELADAHGSGPCDSNIMRVQVPFSARKGSTERLDLFCAERDLSPFASQTGSKVSASEELASVGAKKRPLDASAPFSAELQKGHEPD